MNQKYYKNKNAFYDSEWWDYNAPNDKSITKREEEFASELFELLQKIINDEDKKPNGIEDCASKSNLIQKFNKHCLGMYIKHKSLNTWVYYDFKYINQYKAYLEGTASKMLNIDIYRSLYELDNIAKWIQNSSEEKYMMFGIPCNFTYNGKRVLLGIHAYANISTKNYKNHNTIDIIIFSTKFKILSIFPIDADYFENKIKCLLNEYSIKQIGEMDSK